MRRHPVRELEDRKSNEPQVNLIPQFCYQTWESRFLTKRHLSEVEKFRDLNPDLSWMLFDAKQRASYMFEYFGGHHIYEIYKSAKYGVTQADIFRYCILFERGGYYFDISKSCDIQLSKLHCRGTSALISFENNNCTIPFSNSNMGLLREPFKYAVQWGFAFTAGHPILDSVINNIVAAYPFFKDRVFPNPQVGILAFTGPGVFTKSLRETLTKDLASGVTQHSSDFSGHGIFSLPGSQLRFNEVKHYSTYSNSIIVK